MRAGRAIPPAAITGTSPTASHHHRNERQRRHPAYMAAALGALRDDGVGAGFDAGQRLRYAARHVGDLAARIPGASNPGFHVLVGARPGERHGGRAFVQGGLETLFFGVKDQKIQGERAVGLAPDFGGGSLYLGRAETVASHGAQPAGFRNRGDERRRMDRSHAAEKDRVVDVEHVADRCSDHEKTPCFILIREE